MGVMSIPCCVLPINKKSGPLFVRAGWHHFVTMTKTGEITTWIPKTPLVIDTMGATADYWETDGTKLSKLKYRTSEYWNKLDTTYHINARGVCGSCLDLSLNLNLGAENVSIFQNTECCTNQTINVPDIDLTNCNAVYYAPGTPCHRKCNYTSSRELVGEGIDYTTTYSSGYMNADGSTDGTGVSLDIIQSTWDPDQKTPGTTGPRWVNWETPAEQAPPNHPLATPDFGALFAKDVECGAYHNIVRLSDNSIMAWGLNSMGQCNVPESLLPSFLRPAGVAPHKKRNKIFSLHCGFSTSAVMFNDGTVLCWGDPEVADEVNTWKFIKTSPIKRKSSEGVQDSCVGTPSRGYPELLPGGNLNVGSDWVAEELYKNSKYNANTDWWGHWHEGVPGFPHFDLGVATDYVYPVNWNDVTNGASTSDKSNDQWSYRYATKEGLESPCAVKGRNIKDYAVAMLRTGQIITTRKENAPAERKGDISKLCRDCSTDLITDIDDGTYKPSDAIKSVADSIINGTDCVAQSIELTYGFRCRNPVTCDAYRSWKLNFTGENKCANGYYNETIPEGVGCFSSSPEEVGYDPNWADTHLDKFTSAGHAVGVRNEGVNKPSWNSVQANYGWASLPTRITRQRDFCEPCAHYCRVDFKLPNCSAIIANYDPCNYECPNVGVGNAKALPGKTTDTLKGSYGYFRYPQHLMGFGCVAGSNTTCWLGPAKMLSSAVTQAALDTLGGDTTTLNSTAKIIATSYSQLVFNNSRGDACADCAFIGSSIDHQFHLTNISTGCRFHSERDPDNKSNPLIDGGICLDSIIPVKFVNSNNIMPSKPWGPFYLNTNIGSLPHPPLLEGIAVDRKIGTLPYTGPHNGILGSINFRGRWDFRVNGPLTCGLRQSLINRIQNDNRNLDYPDEFNNYATQLGEARLYPVGAAYSARGECACWMDSVPSTNKESIETDYKPSTCRNNGCGGTDNRPGDIYTGNNNHGQDGHCTGLEYDWNHVETGGQSDAGKTGQFEYYPPCSGAMDFDCGDYGKPWNPTAASKPRKFGTGFTLEEYSNSRGILCSAISIDGNRMATAGIALVGKCTINIWNTTKSIIPPTQPNKEIDIETEFSISGIKFISNTELFIRFDDLLTNRKFAILDINTEEITDIDFPLYDDGYSNSFYNVGVGALNSCIISSNTTAVSLKDGSNSFRFATTNKFGNRLLIFKYIQTPIPGFTLEGAFSTEDIFAPTIDTIKLLNGNRNLDLKISGLEISKDGKTIAVGEGNEAFTTAVWGLTGCPQGSVCVHDNTIGLNLSLDPDKFTQLPSYEIIYNTNGVGTLIGLEQNVIKFDTTEKLLGVYGQRLDAPGKYSWEVKRWNLCYGSRDNADCSTLIRNDSVGSIDMTTKVPSMILSPRIANFNNTLNHFATTTTGYLSEFDQNGCGAANNSSDIIYKNFTTNTTTTFTNVYAEPVTWWRSLSSINFIPNSHNILISFYVEPDGWSRDPKRNLKLSEAIVIDYTIDYSSGAYPIWTPKMCGYRGGVQAVPPPVSWKGEYDLGCNTGWEKSPFDGTRWPDIKIGENVCDCDQSFNDDVYNRWMWNNPTLSYASGRTWAVHLRRTPWYRDRNNASVFQWKEGCRESPEWGTSNMSGQGHLQKAYSHKIKNYDDVKIWITGWMHDPCPPWPLDTWNSNLDIDIDLPPTEKDTLEDIFVSGTVGPDGLSAVPGSKKTISVKNCAKYPSWVPVPKANGTTNRNPGYSYKGKWIGDKWAQAMFAVSANDCGIAGNINDIVESCGLSAAYQSICTECEKAWTEPLPEPDMHVSDTYTIYDGN